MGEGEPREVVGGALVGHDCERPAPGAEVEGGRARAGAEAEVEMEGEEEQVGGRHLRPGEHGVVDEPGVEEDEHGGEQGGAPAHELARQEVQGQHEQRAEGGGEDLVHPEAIAEQRQAEGGAEVEQGRAGGEVVVGEPGARAAARRARIRLRDRVVLPPVAVPVPPRVDGAHPLQADQREVEQGPPSEPRPRHGRAKGTARGPGRHEAEDDGHRPHDRVHHRGRRRRDVGDEGARADEGQAEAARHGRALLGVEEGEVEGGEQSGDPDQKRHGEDDHRQLDPAPGRAHRLRVDCRRSWPGLGGPPPAGGLDYDGMLTSTSRPSRALVMAGAVSAILAAAPPTSRGQDPDTRRTALTVSPGPRANDWKRAFNPFRNDTDTRWPATAGVYEPLIVYSRATRTYVPWLATAYKWGAGNLSLRFSIRPGVLWSDGAPFSARDVAITFDLMRRFPALDRQGVWRFLGDVNVVDPAPVEFTFKRAYTPGFVAVGTQPIVAA